MLSSILNKQNSTIWRERPIVITIKQAIAKIQGSLNKEDGAAASWIMSWITGKSYTQLIALQDARLSEEQEMLLDKTLKELIDEHKPLQYILGSVPFLSLDIAVRPPILIPRPETEYWCSWLIQQLEPVKNAPLRALDLCTGTGCIGIALAQALPNAQVYAGDISPAACALAQENADRNRVGNITIVESDLYDSLPVNSFDIIVSNPPYITAQEWGQLEPRVKNWEDPGALLADDDGLALLKKIIEQAPTHTRQLEAVTVHAIPQLVLETGYLQAAAVRDLMIAAGYNNVIVHQDQCGRDRFVTGSL